MNERFFQVKTINGESVTAGETTVTPQAQAVSLQLPFWGFVWNRPTAVLVEENGRTERIPIIDMTRLAILAAAGLGTAVAVLSWLMRSKK
jgi:hypothetical protein